MAWNRQKTELLLCPRYAWGFCPFVKLAASPAIQDRPTDERITWWGEGPALICSPARGASLTAGANCCGPSRRRASGRSLLVDALQGAEAAAAHRARPDRSGRAGCGGFRAVGARALAADGEMAIACISMHEGVRPLPLHADNAGLLRRDHRQRGVLAQGVAHAPPRFRRPTAHAQSADRVLDLPLVSESELVVAGRQEATFARLPDIALR
mmetsp:Transcript_106146/g.307145  ORF Transcript_106146/g.307145 Transcript_106146/m.307145 type:complete len:211 (-) Transcript_106146:804-1436(-)